MDRSSPGSSVHGMLQTGILECSSTKCSVMAHQLHSDSESNFSGRPIRLYVLAQPQPCPLTSLSHLSTSTPLVHCVLTTVAPLLFFKYVGSSFCWVFARAIPSAWDSFSQHSHIAGSLSSFKFSLKYLTIWRLILITLFKCAKCQSLIPSPYYSGLLLKLIDL